MINNISLEELEKRYLDYIVISLRQDLNGLVRGLNSRIKLLNDWRNKFLKTARKGYKASDLDAGAERIFHHLFTPMFKFPNSCPIGSDLMYQTEDAIVQIEIKTNLVTNPDYKGKVQLGRNQVSYGFTNFKPNLPSIYKSVKLPTLTYVIQIVHEYMNPKINALNVICIPNGRLLKHYGPDILQAGKGGWKKATDIRYKYIEEPRFLLLTKKYNKNVFRIEILILDKNLGIKGLMGKKLAITPYKII
ncbi:hypothetical protein JXK06_02675 [Patescibacteria group bacterium]|nr:hypothetical protein [Patescibacteria group bacterium]